MLARSKLNSIKSKISEPLINNQISHEDFMTIINEERNYRELKESITMIKGQEDKKIDCLKCRKNTENINPRVLKTINGKTMILSKCAIYVSKKSKFIKKQEEKGLLRSLGIRTPFRKVFIWGSIFF